MEQFNGKVLGSKNLILAFASIYGKLPSRNSSDSVEVGLAQKMENYLSYKSPSFDESFRAYIFEHFPRRTNNKRSHNKEARISELKSFITYFGRLPRTRNVTTGRLSREELLARSALDNYASPNSALFDQEVYNFVKQADPHYGNQALAISKRG